MKMKKILTIILSIIVAVSFNGCKATQNTEPQDDARIKIVTTLFPYYDFVRAVTKGVDGISITMTVAPGQDSHSFEPTPKDIIKIENADLFIYNGGTLETWVDSVLGALSNDEQVMRMMDYVDVMEEETVEGMDLRYEHSHDHSEEMHSHSEESEHSHDEENEHSHDEESEHSHDDKEYDEHIWTSPVNAMKMVGYICDEMIKIDPENAEIYKANADEYIGKIQNIDTQIRKIVNKMDKKEIIFADKFPLLYFAKEYGLSYYAAFPGCAEDTEPSARTIAFLIDKINEDKINKVYYLELSSKAVANTIDMIFECENVTLGYENKIVISNLSFTIDKGDYVCIVGENGTGKSTLVKTILGLIKPLEGKMNLKEGKIGYLPQQTMIQKDFPASVWEVVLSGNLNNKRKIPFYTKADRQEAMKNMEKLGITNLKKTCYGELSGGQQQRVLLARALCAMSNVLILDEPVTGLDPTATKEMYELIKELNVKDNVTIIMVTHDIENAVNYANKILHLGRKKYFYGTVEEYEKSNTSDAFLGGNE